VQDSVDEESERPFSKALFVVRVKSFDDRPPWQDKNQAKN